MLRFNVRGRAISASGPADEEAAGTSRRSFLRSSGGIAAMVAVPGTAAVAVSASVAEAVTAAPHAVANPTTAAPAHPVMAYIHDAKRGEVVIMTGSTERTVIDHELVRRLEHRPGKAKHHRTVRR